MRAEAAGLQGKPGVIQPLALGHDGPRAAGEQPLWFTERLTGPSAYLGLCTCSKSHSIAWPKDPGGTENHNERSVLDWPATEQPFKNISLRPNQSRRKTTIHLVRTKQH
ncbi:hypothetical protein ACHWQZ_G014755 [Mnemiopsis leidyi]